MQCRQCEAEIMFVKVVNRQGQEKNHPVNLPGFLGIVKQGDGYIFAKSYQSHFDTCPAAQHYRERGRQRDPNYKRQKEVWDNESVPTKRRPEMPKSDNSDEAKQFDRALVKRIEAFYDNGQLNDWEANFFHSMVSAVEKWGTLTPNKREICNRILREAPERAIPEHPGNQEEEMESDVGVSDGSDFEDGDLPF